MVWSSIDFIGVGRTAIRVPHRIARPDRTRPRLSLEQLRRQECESNPREYVNQHPGGIHDQDQDHEGCGRPRIRQAVEDRRGPGAHRGRGPDSRQDLIPGHEIVGRIEAVGIGVDDHRPVERVGIPWLGHICRICPYCRSARENLCEDPQFTGNTRDGGYATSGLEFMNLVRKGYFAHVTDTGKKNAGGHLCLEAR
ncbi:alcohol dehydrogenase catalytic domain-containing protein [Kaistia defluvii]|uniref:alcohol dehydrogenase catalytic domain-containing protein n=1 Tax=Kaistia defluvii TaxID=410841 RepID=UPI0022501F86|nr:alcohol dehydrogenase catalytic domain-containing protein [Kaistia defluvii]MCX5520175.1 alcohol dehydrogenase catalytic domain-containing protein [Kaistia defluvii]